MSVNELRGMGHPRVNAYDDRPTPTRNKETERED